MYSFLPKHAKLVLNCYPRCTENATVLPNSSELKYLLYYASNRRSKIQKVMAFLQNKNSRDVRRNKLSNVQLNLQIVTALIQQLPRDLPLYAVYVLNILGDVLRFQDINMVEDSVSTFESFCKHQETATLAASQSYLDQFEKVVSLYASYAALKTPVRAKGGFNTPTAIRWRIACLKALKAVTASEAISADEGQLMNIVMAPVLQNLHSGDPDHLIQVQQQAQSEAGEDKSSRENERRRRMSVATARTSEKSRPNSAAVDGALDDADLIAEEEVSLLALQTLKQIFTVNDRVQIRFATNAMLKFIYHEAPTKRPTTSRSCRSGLGATWSTTLIETAANWTPVQDRFVIMTTIMEVLETLPMSENYLQKQLQIVSLVDWLLRSNINMIGLSVIDVLLRLIHKLMAYLRLCYHTDDLPTLRQADVTDLSKNKYTVLNGPPSPAITESSSTEEAIPSVQQALLTKFRESIAALAMHLYYTDQVRDVVSTLLRRMRPFVPVQSGESSVRSDVSENYFTSSAAKITALNAIKEALVVANTKGSVTGGAAIGRRRVSMKAWKSTKWLAHDPDPHVRGSYMDTLHTFCRLEISMQDRLELQGLDKSFQLWMLMHYLDSHKSESRATTPPKIAENKPVPATLASKTTEDPDANAAALRGAVPKIAAEKEIPPVPPLPKGLKATIVDGRIDVEELMRRIIIPVETREKMEPPYIL